MSILDWLHNKKSSAGADPADDIIIIFQCPLDGEHTSFSAGTELPEHAAPGDALIFALDGEGIIGYEGKEYRIHAGENFRFDKGGRHFVKASSNFKMALLLTV
jgi:quercetin dioxygenase-like cupin family protein